MLLFQIEGDEPVILNNIEKTFYLHIVACILCFGAGMYYDKKYVYFYFSNHHENFSHVNTSLHYDTLHHQLHL